MPLTRSKLGTQPKLDAAAIRNQQARVAQVAANSDRSRPRKSSGDPLSLTVTSADGLDRVAAVKATSPAPESSGKTSGSQPRGSPPPVFAPVQHHPPHAHGKDLAGVYIGKCKKLSIPANPEMRSRLTLLDRSEVKNREFDFNMIPVDGSFECLVEVLLLAASVKAIDASGTRMKDHHVDILVHHLSRSIGIRSLNVSKNPGITKEGGRMLLELAKSSNYITSIDCHDTNIPRELLEEIAVAVDDNHQNASHSSQGDIHSGLASPKGGVAHQQLHWNSSFNLMHGTLNGALSANLGLSGSNLHRVGTKRGDNNNAVQIYGNNPTTANVSKNISNLSLFLLLCAEKVLKLMCWDDIARSAAILFIGITSLFFEASSGVFLTLMLGAFLSSKNRLTLRSSQQQKVEEENRLLLQQQIQPKSFVEQLYKNTKFYTEALAPLRPGSIIEDKEKVDAALETLDRFTEKVVSVVEHYTLRGGKSRLLQLMGALSFLCCLVSFSTILGCAFTFCMLWHPIGSRLAGATPVVKRMIVEALGGTMENQNQQLQLLSSSGAIALQDDSVSALPTAKQVTDREGHLKVPRLSSKRIGSPHGGDRSPSQASSFSLTDSATRDDTFDSPFPFVVELVRLIDIDSAQLSAKGFVPMVQIKYNRKAWVSDKAREPWEWNAKSEPFCFLPMRRKLTFVIYDDAHEMIGAVSEGSIILDDSAQLDEQIVVPLHRATQEDSLLKTLVDDVVAHEKRSQQKHSRHVGASVGSLGGMFGFGTENSSSAPSKPGSLVIRLRHFEEEAQPQQVLLPHAPTFAQQAQVKGPAAPGISQGTSSHATSQPGSIPHQTSQAVKPSHMLSPPADVEIEDEAWTVGANSHRGATALHSGESSVHHQVPPAETGRTSDEGELPPHQGGSTNTAVPPVNLAAATGYTLPRALQGTTPRIEDTTPASSPMKREETSEPPVVSITPASPQTGIKGGVDGPRSTSTETELPISRGGRGYATTVSPSPTAPESIVVESSIGSARTSASTTTDSSSYVFLAKGGGNIRKRPPPPTL